MDATRSPSRPVTAADVGRVAGVSRSTVSLVLNDAPGHSIPEATRERVRLVASELGYVPHSQAASLRRGHSNTILIPSPPGRVGSLVASWIDSVEEVLEAQGYTVIIHGGRFSSEADAVKKWLALRPLAVLTLGGGDLSDATIDALHRGGVRAVVLTDQIPRRGAHVFRLDHADAGRAALAHLADRGRERVGLVLPTEPLLRPIAHRRLSARTDFVDRMDFEIIEVGLDEAGAAELAKRAVDSHLDAVFAFNDDYAVMALAGLLDRGVEVPREVAVVGGDAQSWSAFARPALSSVAVSLPAPRRILDILRAATSDEGWTESFQELDQPTMVPRGST